jgi:predicted membrane protein
VSQVFTFTKFAVLILFLLMDVRLAAYYGFLCVVLWMMLKQPKYEGPRKIMKIATRQEFEQLVSSEVMFQINSGKQKKVVAKRDFT